MKRFWLEMCFWVLALLLFAMAKIKEPHFTLCPLANLGWRGCPGCGLGRSIILLFDGQFKQSLSQHWFGIPAVAIILYRIVQLWRLNFNKSIITEKY